MTKDFVWGLEMSNSDFVQASEKYFEKSYWNLHEACCLVVKHDPEEHPGVGQGHVSWSLNDLDSDKDLTRRAFTTALRCINGNEADLLFHGWHKLPTHSKKKKIKTGKDVIVDSKVFVIWAINVWSGRVEHFELALEQREARKLKSKNGFLRLKQKPERTKKERQQVKAFRELCDELGKDAETLSDRKLGIKLEQRISGESFAAKSETLRRKIKKWRL